MCPHVSMCPHVANGLRHSYSHWYLLSIVHSCVWMCPYAPCGQWFNTYQYPLRLVFHCEILCQYVPMCSHVADSFINTYNLRDWLAILSLCDFMCPSAPLCPMVWYYPYSPLPVVHFELVFTYVPICLMWPMVRDTTITSNSRFPLWTCVSLCDRVAMWPMVWYTPITYDTGYSL